jgi:hypothetical protein
VSNEIASAANSEGGRRVDAWQATVDSSPGAQPDPPMPATLRVWHEHVNLRLERSSWTISLRLAPHSPGVIGCAECFGPRGLATWGRPERSALHRPRSSPLTGYEAKASLATGS